MTYNILTGGRDGSDESRWPLIVQQIREAQPDLLVLNECNEFDSNRNRNLHRMEREIGMRGVLAHADTGFHVGIFSRDAAFVESHASSSLHHAMLEARLAWREHDISLVGVHLCPFGGQNRVAEAELLTRLARQDTWVFIAGDMNAISRHDAESCAYEQWVPRRQARHLLPDRSAIDTRAMAVLENAGLVDLAHHAGVNSLPTALTPLRTDHANYRLRIDYVFGSERVAKHLQTVAVPNTDNAKRASDHFPVVVDVALS
jgi:endonuclease/exonuclease/phosphatase family metal-dependent hydrolase